MSQSFTYLRSQASTGFTPTQFQIYRDNFFYRTLNTIPSIAGVGIAAALEQNYEAMAEAGKNLFDETGSGDQLKVHSRLLEESHNLHAGRVFGLSGIKLKDAGGSTYLLEEARTFRRGHGDRELSDAEVWEFWV